MKSDYPLILRFHNVTLGELKLCLSPFSMNVDYFCDVCKKPWQTMLTSMKSPLSLRACL
jgi:hypothetical protein